jgi:predicted short-subunit dehydrogenase-like oxidoreductase (DUF2520 family)
MQETLAIVGAGRVGRALGRRLHELGWHVGAVVARSEASARRAVRFIGAGSAHASLSRRVLNSTLILVTTPDSAIDEIGKELARIGAEELQGRVVLHTSGALDSGALDAARGCGAATGSMHPLQTFSGVGVPPLEGKVFAIEGDPTAVRAARKIARALGGSPVHIDAPDKPRYHAAGVLGAGHVLVIVEAAIQLMMSLQMKRGEAMRAVLPMTRQVLQNYERLGPRAAWTGPLARGDYQVIAKHIEALQQYSVEYHEAYEALNRLAGRVLARDAADAVPATAGTILQITKAKAKATGGKG